MGLHHETDQRGAVMKTWCNRCGEYVEEMVRSDLDDGGLACFACGDILVPHGKTRETVTSGDPWWVCLCGWEGRDPDWERDEDDELIPCCPECEAEVSDD